VVKLYIVRHGKDEDGYLGGWSQRGLTSEGMEQADKLSCYLKRMQKDFQIQHIVSSDLTRAAMTAELIAQELSLPIEMDKRFREMNNGDLAGLPIEEAKVKYPGLYFSTLEMDEPYPNGESPKQFYERIQRHFAASIETFKKDTTLLITHGGVINIIWHWVKGLSWSNKSTSCKAGNCSLFVLNLESMTFEVENQVDFLED